MHWTLLIVICWNMATVHMAIIITTMEPITNSSMYADHPMLLELIMSNQISFEFPKDEVLLEHNTLSSYVCNNCAVRSIYQLSFSRIPQLTSLMLQNNSLEYVHPDAFANNSRLEKLCLIDNKLTTFNPEATLRHISALSVIDISNNYNLDLNKFKIVSDRLLILKCNNCNTRYLNRNTLAGLPRISQVSLGNNSLENIYSDALESISYIKTLNINDNPGLRFLVITSNTLRTLNAQNCSLDRILHLPGVPSLRDLNVRHNQIRHLDELELVSHKNIKTLLLDDNEIKKIPTRIIKMSQLQQLCIDRNLLQPYEHEHEASHMYIKRHLRHACLEDNDIGHQFEYQLPSGSGIAVYRKKPVHYVSKNGLTVDLSNRNIIFIEKDYVKDYPNVIEFVFDNNHKYELMDTMAFLESASIESLSMQNGSITAIYKSTFEKLPSLKSLNLQGNKIQTLHSCLLFLKNPQLAYINIANNNLELISANVFQSVYNLEEIILDGNNRLSNTEEGFIVSTSLRHLSCVNCGFTRIDNQILSLLPKLRSLNLQNNELNSCVPLIKYLNRLQMLCLDDRALDDATLQAFEDHINRVTELEVNCEKKKLSSRLRRNYNMKTTTEATTVERSLDEPTFNKLSIRMFQKSSCTTNTSNILIVLSPVLAIYFRHMNIV